MSVPMIRRAVAGALAAALVLGLSGLALAHTVSFRTRLTINPKPDGRVSAGETVVFKGRLASPRSGCESRSRIQLILVGQGVVAKTRTDREGRYRFEQVVNETSTWRTRFKGKALNAVHPHNHTCERSRSPKIRVRVV